MCGGGRTRHLAEACAGVAVTKEWLERRASPPLTHFPFGDDERVTMPKRASAMSYYGDNGLFDST